MPAVFIGVAASESPTRIGNALAAAPPTVAETSAPADGTMAPADGTTAPKIIYDHHSLMIDGKRTYIWSGEFQYRRLPSPSLWHVFRSTLAW